MSRPTEVELETYDGFSLLVSVTDEGVAWEWWTPMGKTELAYASLTHEDIRKMASETPNYAHKGTP